MLILYYETRTRTSDMTQTPTHLTRKII